MTIFTDFAACKTKWQNSPNLNNFWQTFGVPSNKIPPRVVVRILEKSGNLERKFLRKSQNYDLFRVNLYLLNIDVDEYNLRVNSKGKI